MSGHALALALVTAFYACAPSYELMPKSEARHPLLDFKAPAELPGPFARITATPPKEPGRRSINIGAHRLRRVDTRLDEGKGTTTVFSPQLSLALGAGPLKRRAGARLGTEDLWLFVWWKADRLHRASLRGPCALIDPETVAPHWGAPEDGKWQSEDMQAELRKPEGRCVLKFSPRSGSDGAAPE